jgi:tRNA-intron lyase
MQKTLISSHKKKVNEPCPVNVPLPIPLKDETTGEILWPLKTPALVPFFTGVFNRQGNCVYIFCRTGGLCLSSMGSFGTSASYTTPKYFLSESLSLQDVLSTKGASCTKEMRQTESLDKFLKKVITGSLDQDKTIEDLYAGKGEDEESFSYGRSKQNLQEMNPEPFLKLFLEEAFFLSYGLGNLNIKCDLSDESQSLNLDEIWNLFRDSFEDNKMFVVKYAAYHYFRSKGWVVKEGTNYGSDFVLYQERPEFYHSFFSVIVTRVDETGRHPKISCQFLNGLQRISENVSKNVLICDVTIPHDVTHEDLKSPFVTRRLQVDCMFVERWTGSDSSD